MLAMFNAAALEMRSNAEANGLVIRIDMIFPMHGYQLGLRNQKEIQAKRILGAPVPKKSIKELAEENDLNPGWLKGIKEPTPSKTPTPTLGMMTTEKEPKTSSVMPAPVPQSKRKEKKTEKKEARHTKKQAVKAQENSLRDGAPEEEEEKEMLVDKEFTATNPAQPALFGQKRPKQMGQFSVSEQSSRKNPKFGVIKDSCFMVPFVLDINLATGGVLCLRQRSQRVVSSLSAMAYSGHLVDVYGRTHRVAKRSLAGIKHKHKIEFDSVAVGNRHTTIQALDPATKGLTIRAKSLKQVKGLMVASLKATMPDFFAPVMEQLQRVEKNTSEMQSSMKENSEASALCSVAGSIQDKPRTAADATKCIAIMMEKVARMKNLQFNLSKEEEANEAAILKGKKKKEKEARIRVQQQEDEEADRLATEAKRIRDLKRQQLEEQSD
jgi:hypothetical protein